MVLFNGSGEEAGEFGGRRRQLGPGGIDLGFDVEVKVAPGRQRQHLIEWVSGFLEQSAAWGTTDSFSRRSPIGGVRRGSSDGWAAVCQALRRALD